jgi:rubrerythrin
VGTGIETGGLMENGGGTFSDLRTAFVAEAMTAQRYTYFATIAQIEGHSDVAKLFGELAESMACAAHGHLDFLRQDSDPTTGAPIGDTPRNLAAAVAGELRDATDLYPGLVTTAHREGLADVASWGQTLHVLKRAHVAKLQDALIAVAARSSTGRNGKVHPTDPGQMHSGDA